MEAIFIVIFLVILTAFLMYAYKREPCDDNGVDVASDRKKRVRWARKKQVRVYRKGTGSITGEGYASL